MQTCSQAWATRMRSPGAFPKHSPSSSRRSEGDVSINAMGLGLAVRVSRLADAYLHAGRTDEALARARSAVELSRKHQERANEAIGLRILAEVTALGDPRDAVGAATSYVDSLALAQELGMRPLVAHCHLGLGKLSRRAGDRANSEQHLQTGPSIA